MAAAGRAERAGDVGYRRVAGFDTPHGGSQGFTPDLGHDQLSEAGWSPRWAPAGPWSWGSCDPHSGPATAPATPQQATGADAAGKGAGARGSSCHPVAAAGELACQPGARAPAAPKSRSRPWFPCISQRSSPGTGRLILAPPLAAAGHLLPVLRRQPRMPIPGNGCGGGGGGACGLARAPLERPRHAQAGRHRPAGSARGR